MTSFSSQPFLKTLNLLCFLPPMLPAHALTSVINNHQGLPCMFGPYSISLSSPPHSKGVFFTQLFNFSISLHPTIFLSLITWFSGQPPNSHDFCIMYVLGPHVAVHGPKPPISSHENLGTKRWVLHFSSPISHLSQSSLCVPHMFPSAQTCSFIPEPTATLPRQAVTTSTPV